MKKKKKKSATSEGESFIQKAVDIKIEDPEVSANPLISKETNVMGEDPAAEADVRTDVRGHKWTLKDMEEL